jgi:hypothetical protein
MKASGLASSKRFEMTVSPRFDGIVPGSSFVDLAESYMDHMDSVIRSATRATHSLRLAMLRAIAS